MIILKLWIISILYLVKLNRLSSYGCRSTNQLFKYYERNSILPSFLKQELQLSKFLPFGKTLTKKALNGLTVTFPQGNIIGIIGPSSCGKSTLGNLILGQEKPTSGSIEYSNDVLIIPTKVNNLVKLTYDESKKVKEYLFTNLYPPELAQNLRFLLCKIGIDEDRRINQLLQSERIIFDILHASLLSYRKTISSSASRSMSSKPVSFLLVLDEFLDKEVSSVQQKVCQFFSYHQTISINCHSLYFQTIIITHSLYVAKNCCDYIISMENGRLLDQGTRQEFSSLRKSSFIDFV
eukprot:gene1526-1615_t